MKRTSFRLRWRFVSGLAFVFALAACGGDDTSTGAGSGGAAGSASAGASGSGGAAGSGGASGSGGSGGGAGGDDAGEPDCGGVRCPAGKVCCNPIMGICTDRDGGVCIQ